MASRRKSNRLYFENLAQGGALLPGALELVQDLSREYQLYIVTNGNAVSQMSRLKRSGLLPYVQDVFRLGGRRRGQAGCALL